MSATPAGARRLHQWAVVLLLLALLAAASPATGGGEAAGVRRLAGQAREHTAAAIALDGWPSASAAVLADAHHPMAVLVAGHLAARLDLPLLASREGEVPQPTRDAIESLGVSRGFVVGDAAVPDVVEVTARLDADDPVALAAAAVGVVPPAEGQPFVLARADTFADALAAASLAPAALLLTGRDRLADAAADVLRQHAPDEVILLGGTAALSEAIAEEVRALGPGVTRIAGDDRVQTAVLTAEWASRTQVAVIASRDTAADAVAAVPWAARRQAAVLLTAPGDLSTVVDDRLRATSPGEVIIAGGPAAVHEFTAAQVQAAAAGVEPPGFVGEIRSLTADERAAMTGVSWHEGCPVPLADLRVVEGRRIDLDGVVADDGQLIVHDDAAPDVIDVLRVAFEARWPIHRMDPIREFDGDDDASMAADNSSGFNCRVVAGTSTWSPHAYGRAIDLNPVENPYVRGDRVEPPAGEAFLDRGDVRPGMAVEGDVVVAAFDAAGWGWGGRWQDASDHQHFSVTGR